MTTCTLIITGIICTIDPTTKPTPAEAAKILAPNQFVSYPETPYGIQSFSTGSIGPTPGPWTFPSPRQRLDGSLMNEPQWFSQVYIGHGYRGVYRGSNHGGGSRRGNRGGGRRR